MKGQERWTVWNVHTVQDERSETFAKSRSRSRLIGKLFKNFAAEFQKSLPIKTYFFMVKLNFRTFFMNPTFSSLGQLNVIDLFNTLIFKVYLKISFVSSLEWKRKFLIKTVFKWRKTQSLFVYFQKELEFKYLHSVIKWKMKKNVSRLFFSFNFLLSISFY